MKMKNDLDKMIDGALRKEPDFHLSRDFSGQVIRQLRKAEKARRRKMYVWITFGSLLGFGLCAGVLAYFIPAVWLQSLKSDGFDQIIPLAVAVGLVVGVIQYLDKKLVKDKMLRMH